jgi:hypothetical protein
MDAAKKFLLYISIPGLAWRLKKVVKMSVRLFHNGVHITPGYTLNSIPVLIKKHKPKVSNVAPNTEKIFKLIKIRGFICFHTTFFSYLSYFKV